MKPQHQLSMRKLFHTLSQSGKVLKLNSVNTILRTYTGEVIPVVGECELEVEYNGFTGNLPAVVISGEGPCLLGRNWLQHISLDWSAIFNLTTMDTQLNEILEAHSTVFQEGLGKVEGVKAKIYIDTSEKPRFFKARPVAYTLREQIERELDRLVKEGTIEPVEFSEWATPIVTTAEWSFAVFIRPPRFCFPFVIITLQLSHLFDHRLFNTR